LTETGGVEETSYGIGMKKNVNDIMVAWSRIQGKMVPLYSTIRATLRPAHLFPKNKSKP